MALSRIQYLKYSILRCFYLLLLLFEIMLIWNSDHTEEYNEKNGIAIIYTKQGTAYCYSIELQV
jgi:hypothetical protein